MSKKEISVEYAKKNFADKTLELILKQIELFLIIMKKNKNLFSVGEDVKLTKGTFLHGIPNEDSFFEFIIDTGVISSDFTNTATGTNKIKNSIGMWNLKEDCFLRDYINDYSGFTITCKYGRGLDKPLKSMMIPYHKFDEVTEKINDDEEIYLWWGDKTKEVTFLPSLVSNKRQIAFILNMDSEYAKKMAYADVWNVDLDEKILESFLDYRYYPEFINLRFSKDASSTDRESSIMFGLPPTLIEGVLVGRNIEKNIEKLNYINLNCLIATFVI